MKKYVCYLCFTSAILLLCFHSGLSQDITCPTIVQTALETVDSACAETGRNQACYGNITLIAEPQSGVEDFTFDAPGDIANVADIQSLTLSNMDESINGWGIALMRLQANLPDTLPGQNVTVLLFGDVDIQDAGGDAPMQAFQAFTFRSGIGDAPCEAAPDSGILIQTPEGAAEVTLLVNEAKISLGSTVYLQAVAGEAMTVFVIEGQATIAAFDRTVIVPAGMTARVPVDEDRGVSGPPDEAEASPAGLIEDLTPVLAILPEPIAPPVPESTTNETTVEDQDTCTVTAAGNVNLRSGPGTVYGRSGGITPGDSESPVGQVIGVDGYVWWQLSNGSWVRSDVVQSSGDCGGLPVVIDIPPVPTPAPASPVTTQGQASSNCGQHVGIDRGFCHIDDYAYTTACAGKVTLSMGQSRPYWATCEDAMAAGESQGLATFTGTGPAPTNYRLQPNCHWNEDASWWGIAMSADVVLTPGVYTYTGTWLDGETASCTFTVE